MVLFFIGIMKKVLFISIFTHWLDEKEADECSILCYSIAKDCNVLENYLKGEQRFLNFYQSLDRLAHIACDNNIVILNTKENDFIKILKNGLREIKPFKIKFPNLDIIIESGYDRTDRVIVGKNANIEFILNMIDYHQLYVIDEIDYDAYMNTFKM